MNLDFSRDSGHLATNLHPDAESPRGGASQGAKRERSARKEGARGGSGAREEREAREERSERGARGKKEGEEGREGEARRERSKMRLEAGAGELGISRGFWRGG